MNSNKKGGLIVSLFLSVFFIVIALFVLLLVLKVSDYEVGMAALTFTIVNLLVFSGVIGLGKLLVARIGVGSYAPIAMTTVLYTILQFGHLGICYQSDNVTRYVLFHLILLFIYFMIVLPIGVVGMNHHNDQTK